MTEYLNGKELPLTELKLADCVEAFSGPYGTAIVRKIEGDIITFYRPYGAHHDFSYTGGVICLTGVEEVYPHDYRAGNNARLETGGIALTLIVLR